MYQAEGVGAVLSQESYPIAFSPKKISPLMQKQLAYAQEMYVITTTVVKFGHYLLGHHFIVRTDHKSLKEMQTQVIQTPEQQTWLPKLLGYNFNIKYKKVLKIKLLMGFHNPSWPYLNHNLSFFISCSRI